MLSRCDAAAFFAAPCYPKRPPATSPVTMSRRRRKSARNLSFGRGDHNSVCAFPHTITALTFIALFLVTVTFPSSSASHGYGSPPGGSSTMVLRVRMPDGAVKRVTAAASDTVDSIMDKLGVGGDGEGVRTDRGDLPEGATSVASLGLRNGDFLYVKSDTADRAAAKSKAKSMDRIKASTVGSAKKTWDGGSRGNKFVPFPDHARPPPPLAQKRVKTWQDLEAMQAQTFSLKPQKDSNVKKISVEQSAVKEFVGYLRETGYRSHRYALLFGRISAATKGIKVEAMYEPPQASAVDSPGVAEGGSGAHCYDASALTEAAAAAVVAREVGDEDGCGDRVGLSEAAADVLRAVRVAEQLGLRLVGWCLSHDKRGHFMAARDVVTAAAIQLMMMADKGRDEGVLVATVAVSVNATDGEVSTEAFSVSNQTVQMFSEGLLAEDQPEPTSDRVMTTTVVREDSTETRTPETLGLVCNVAIVQHEGVLQTRFPPANRAKPPSLSDLKKCLFGRVRAEGSTGKQKQPSFLKRLSDFQVLMYLSRQMGCSRDFEELCAVVKKRDSKSAALGTLKLVLESLCDASEE